MPYKKMIFCSYKNGQEAKAKVQACSNHKIDLMIEDKNTTNEGTGLGLAITKHLIELMDGNITVQSVYGSGSKFTATIDQRIKKVDAMEEKSDKQVQTVEAEASKTVISNKRVVIIDDNKLNLKVASKLLSNYKIEVIEYDSGQACIEDINNGEKYGLLLADEMMPIMSGTDMMKKLKESGY
ncbi:MAG: response regulator [Mollicutes bacterium]|nr:response regulator [Mollicutes bacterium]